jgi:hypothetical protein
MAAELSNELCAKQIVIKKQFGAVTYSSLVTDGGFNMHFDSKVNNNNNNNNYYYYYSCTIYCNYRITKTLYTPETWFVSGT